MSNVPVVSEFLQSDIENVYYFLISNEYPLPKDITIDLWRTVFKKQWMLGKLNNGFLLKKDDVIVGVLCAIYSTQKVDGVSRGVCNLSTWFVLQEYRNYSLKLMSCILKQKNLIFTSHSIRTDLLPLHRKLGFVEYTNMDLIFIPHFPTISWLLSKVRHYTDISPIKGELDSDIVGISNNYSGIDRVKQILFKKNDQYCFILYKLGYSRKIPCINIVYLSNHEFYSKYMLSVSRYFILHKKILFTRILSSYLNYIPWFAFKIKNRANMMYKDEEGYSLSVREVYSEAVLIR